MRRPALRSQVDTSRSRRVAFTLIEVLVVVAIIALLISILLPSLSRARHLSKAKVCLSHMRQLGIGAVQYSYDFNGYIPPTDPTQKDVGPQDTTSGSWGYYGVGSDDMRAYYGMTAESKNHKYAATLDLWKCPGAGNVVLSWDDLSHTYTSWASYKGTVVNQGSAYEYNPWMYNIVVSPAGTWPPTKQSGKPQFQMLRTNNVKHTSQVMITQDNDDSNVSSSPLPPQGIHNWYPDGNDPHAILGGGNMFYMDGHAVWVLAKDWCKETDSGRKLVRR